MGVSCIRGVCHYNKSRQEAEQKAEKHKPVFDSRNRSIYNVIQILMTEEEEEKLREEHDPTGAVRTLFIALAIGAIFWTVVIIIAVA